MTENEIIKALKCCGGGFGISCRECPYPRTYDANCGNELMRNALDLINRQKVEIGRLKVKIEVIQEAKEQLEKDVFNAEMNCDSILNEYELLKQEKSVVESRAIKEFADRLKKEALKHKIFPLDSCVDFDDIDNLVKEMTGD